MIRTELHLRLPNSPGSLARILTTLDAARIRVLALAVDPSGEARLVPDNPEPAFAALTAQHVRVAKRDVIVTTVPPRSMHALLASVAAAGVNVEYAYASSLDGDAMVALVIGVDDAMRAAAAAGL